MIEFKVDKKNIFLWIIGILLSISAAILAFYNIMYRHYSTVNITLTMITAFEVMFCFFINTADNIILYIKKNTRICVFIFILVLIVLLKLYLVKLMDRLDFKLCTIEFVIFSVFSLSYIGIWLYKKAETFFKEVFSELDEKDKKLYLYISIVVIIAIIIAHTTSKYWHDGWDKVYSMDPVGSHNLFPDPLSSMHDVRHPILITFTFPVYSIIDFISYIFIPENMDALFKSITMQIINSQLLIFAGLLIKIITKSKTVFILYIVSFSTMLYLIIFEKHQLCTFPLILYVYILFKNSKKSTASIIAASGLSPTNFFAVFMELFTKEPIKDKFKKFLKMALFGVLTVICLGNGHLITDGFSELMVQKEKWASLPLSLSEKFISTLKMYHSSFFTLSSSIKDDSYTWTSPVTENITILSVFILIMVITGIVYKRKELFTKFCTVWIIFSFVFFMILNWSPEISPIFNIYFAWAIIPMFKNGIDCIFVNFLKINKKIVYGFLISLMLFANILSIIDIGLFLKTL